MTYANPNQRLNNYKTNLNIRIYKTNFWFKEVALTQSTETWLSDSFFN